MPYTRLFETQEPARADVDTAGGTTLLEFGAPWCGHCIAAQPLIETALQDAPEVRHVKIEDGRGKPLGRSFRVKLWPTLIALRDGVEVARTVRPPSLAHVRSVIEAAA